MSHKAGVCNELFQFSIESKITSFMVGELREAILPVIAYADEMEIEIDLLHVDEIDFEGLLLMVEIKLSALSQGKALRFVRHSRAVAEILWISGLIEFFSTPRFCRESALLKLGQVPDYFEE